MQASRSYLFLLVVLGLTALSVWGFLAVPPKYGLDIKGGIRVTLEIDEGKMTPAQQQNFETARRNTLAVLERRVAQSLGVVEGNVQSKGRNQFIIELPGATDAQEARETLRSSASIKFYHAKTVNTERVNFRTYNVEERGVTDRPVVTFNLRSDPSKVIEPTLENGEKNPEYLAIIESWGEPILQGDQLSRAVGQNAPGGGYQPLMEFSGDGAARMEQWSKQFYNQGENLAAVLDDVVLSIAPLAPNTVLRDNAVIQGSFPADYVRQLTDLLNSGALPVDLKEIEFAQVDPTVGTEALKMMTFAGYISFAVISAFLLAYYVFPGFVALVALGLYVLFTITVLKLVGATFSLAAIAGFILSVGMAVDANILVFERLKEEMRAGKSLMKAVHEGFGRALPAIIDSNACTILTSLVLYNLGTGPVKGFASTLIIGVAISLFTTITVTRSLLVFLVGSGIGANSNLYGLNRQWFGEKYEERANENPLRVVQNWKKLFGISMLFIVPGLIFIFLGGLKPNVEFQGGYEASYRLPADRSAEEVERTLRQNNVRGANVKVVSLGDLRQVYVTVPPMADLEADSEEAARAKVAELAGFTVADQLTYSVVGPTIKEETVRNAVLGVVISVFLIVVYLAVRFGLAVGGFRTGLRFGFSAIGALVHDVLFTLGVAAICGYFLGWEVSALFLTAMLTVIGFSVHDTIVIFDRIRENLRKPLPGEDFENLVNRSISQSLARSINTSMTVVATLIILIIWGTATPDLKFFCVAMLAGIAVGTYSSIFNAAPILYLWDTRVAKRLGFEKSLMGEARREARHVRTTPLAVAADEESRSVVDSQGRSYGQVKRRRSAVERSTVEIDDEP